MSKSQISQRLLTDIIKGPNAVLYHSQLKLISVHPYIDTMTFKLNAVWLNKEKYEDTLDKDWLNVVT